MGLPRSPTSHAVVVLALSLLVVATGALAACGGSSTTATTPPAAVGSPSTASAVAGSPSPGHAATASSIGDGVYLVGTDIPAGRYRGTTVSDTFSVWQIASDANGSSIIASDLATSGQFYVQVKKGQYLKLSGVEIVKAAAAAPTKMRSSVGDGVYLVGTDIPAGRYRGEPTFEMGNWKISRDANGTLVVHSADGLSVSTRGSTPPFYIQVKKGQYLKLYSVKVRRVK